VSNDQDDTEPPSPRETIVLYGHAEAEQTLLAAYRSSRFPHAWLIAGPAGIGKATLAYRMARFMLAHPDPCAPPVLGAKSLHVDADHPVARRIAAQAQPDLLVLERTINEKTGKLRQDIQVDDVRRTVAFFGSTAGEGGWRIAIVDAVDELNPSGANALLKILEEPPRRAVLREARVLGDVLDEHRLGILIADVAGGRTRFERWVLSRRQRWAPGPAAASSTTSTGTWQGTAIGCR